MKKNATTNLPDSEHSVSRRQLIATGAATIATPLFLPSIAKSAHRVPASDRLTIGVIGCGKITKDYHLRELLNAEDVQIVAVCDVDEKRRQNAAKRVSTKFSTPRKKFDGIEAYNDFRKIIERDDIDAVVIGTPENWHAIQLVEACKQKKDVYCEKPLTLTIAEAKLCIDATRKYKTIVQTGSQQRSNVFGPFREAVEIIQSGKLGKISKVTVGVGGPPIPCDLKEEKMEPGLDWNLWLGPAPERPYHSVLSPRGVHNHFPQWRKYKEYAGGGHADMGAHHYDIANWALKLDQSGPVKIIPPENPKTGKGVRFLYENGLEIQHGGPGGCTFYGENGKLRIDRGHLSSDPAKIVVESLKEIRARKQKFAGHHRNWLDCIKSREAPVAEVEKGARTVTQIHLGNLAYELGRELEWDPQKWRFKNDKDNQYLDRERRDPWQLPKI